MIKSKLLISLLLPFVFSCQHIDKYFNEDREKSQEVVIVGGGLSALMSALELKKNQIPYKIYSENEDLAPEIKSAHFPEVGEISFFPYSLNRENKNLKVLFKDILMNYQWNTSKNSHFIKYNNELQDSSKIIEKIRSEFKMEIGSLGLKIPSAITGYESVEQEFNKKNFKILNEKFEKDFLICITEFYFGRRINKINKKDFYLFIKSSDLQFLLEHTDLTLQLTNGWSGFREDLIARVSSANSQMIIKNNYRLIAVNKDQYNWILQFKTPTGIKEIHAKNVIFSMNPETLKGVAGLADHLDEFERAIVKQQEPLFSSHVVAVTSVSNQKLFSYLKSKNKNELNYYKKLLINGGVLFDIESKVKIQFLPMPQNLVIKLEWSELDSKGIERVENINKFLVHLENIFKIEKGALAKELYIYDSLQLKNKNKIPFRYYSAQLSHQNVPAAKPNYVLSSRFYFENNNGLSIEGLLHSGVQSAQYFIEGLNEKK